jgi:subtilase family serine protease
LRVPRPARRARTRRAATAAGGLAAAAVVLAFAAGAVAVPRAVPAGQAGALAGRVGTGSQAETAARRIVPLGLVPGIYESPAARPASPGGLVPNQLAVAYDLGPLRAKGIDGAGQTIVIVDSFGSPTIAHDLATFDSYFGLPAPPSFRVIQPAGKVPPFSRRGSYGAGWAGETSLDVEWAHAMAPGARILLVETPTSENEGTTGFPQIVAAETYVLKHHLGQVISQSFAATEQTFPSKASVLRLRSAYVLAARDHVTVLAASGDQGATGDTYNMTTEYRTRAVSWPATDPLVTAVGGTQLDLRANGTRLTPDVAWSDSGGGKSIFFTRPPYQSRVRRVTGDHRGVPDISMDASCNSAVAVYQSFPGSGGGSWSTICGTSVATPLFAGIVALADQVAGHGRPHGLGLINPAIYQMEASHDKGIVDIRRGNNTYSFTWNGRTYTVRGFSAGKGYDLVSGVGTVNAAYFVPELAKLAGLGQAGSPRSHCESGDQPTVPAAIAIPSAISTRPASCSPLGPTHRATFEPSSRPMSVSMTLTAPKVTAPATTGAW